MLTILVALGGLALMFSLCSPKAEAQWWDNDWTYRVPIEFDINDVPSGYEYRIVLDNTDNLGGNVSFENFQDLRFVENEDGPLLDSWIENVYSGDNCIVWVQRAENADNQIYCYYNNATATRHDNIENTFIFGDDFERAALGANWTVSDATVEISGGIGAKYDDNYMRSDSANTNEVYHPHATGTENNIAFWVNWTGSDVYYVAAFGDATHATYPYLKGTSFYYYSGSEVEVLANFPQNKWTKIEYRDIDLTNHSYDIYINDRENVNDVSMRNIGNYYEDKVTFTHSTPAGYNYIDGFYIRNYIVTEPSSYAGAAEVSSAILVSNSTVDNALIDRDQDMAGSQAVLSTQVSVQVQQTTLGENADSLTDNVHIWIYDGDGNVVVSDATPTDNTIVDENTINFHFAPYTPAPGMGDSPLGNFRVYCEAEDNDSNYDTSNNTTAFVVDDGDNVSLSRNVLPGHAHQVLGTAARVTGGATTLNSATRVDLVDGTETAYISGNVMENTYTVSSAGYAWFLYELNSTLDGISENWSYSYPDMSVELISVSVDNSTIDNHVTDNGISTTTITVTFRDNDNYDDFQSNFWIGVRDATNTVVDNENVTASAVFENENYVIVSLLFDAENYDFAAGDMGTFDVWLYAADNNTDISDWSNTIFFVDDIIVPVSLAPDNATLGYAHGFGVDVTGTVTRASGNPASVDTAFVVDSAEGTFAQGSGNSYSETYTINSLPGATVTVYTRAYDGLLDGISDDNTYTVNDNRHFVWIVRAEDNHLENYNFLSNRTYNMNWYYDNGEGFSENIASHSGSTTLQDSINHVTLSDNGLYWRSLIPDSLGDNNLVFYLVQENSNRDITYEYTYTLLDYTGQYGLDDNGSLRIERVVDNELITITASYWDGDLTVTAWLIYNNEHQYRVRNADGDEQIVAHFWSTLDFDRDVNVPVLEIDEVLFVWNYIRWGAWRDGLFVAISYDDWAENTENVTTDIFAFGDNVSLYNSISTSDNFQILWNGGENTTSYEVRLTIVHGTFGTSVETRSVGPNLEAYIIATPDSADFLGGPVPMVAVFSNMILMIGAFAFGGKYDVQGMFFITMLAAGLRLIGWLPVEWSIIGLLFTISVFWALGKGGR